MSCLDSEQIIALALDHENQPALTHVGTCTKCATRLEKVEEQLGRLETAMNWLDQDHAAERGRLLAVLADVSRSAHPRRPGISRSVKEILAMRRTWIGSAAAAALVIAILYFCSGTGTPLLLAHTAEALREVKSYRCRVLSEDTAASGKKETAVSTWYWAEPGSFRWDMYEKDKVTHGWVSPANKPGLEIDHQAKTFERVPPQRGPLSPVIVLGKLARYAGQADREVAASTIKGIRAPGFEIALTKIDPDIGKGTLSLWIDSATKLPLRAEVAMESVTLRMTFEDFEWNLPSASWFSVEPPAGYKDKTPPSTSPDVEEITKHIVTGLKTYAKYCDGKYPQAKMVYGDVTSMEMNRRAGLPPRSPPKDNALGNVYMECVKASTGFAWMNELQRHDAGAIYHGKTVGPQDRDKVLFRWTRPDGRFRVIYGDLHFDDVSAERLKKLETQ
jgi:outer membrane lipoprotein-sorting protein